MSSGPHTAGPGRVPAFVVPLLTAAGFTYASFLLDFLLRPGLDDVEGDVVGYVSELSAANQPFHWIYSTGDLVTGMIVIIVAATALKTLQRTPWATTGWTFLLLFGACTIADSIFPLDCAPSLDTGCALRERADQVSFSHQFHALTSSAVITCAIITLLALSIAARRHGWWPPIAKYGPPLVAAEVLSVLMTLQLMITGTWLGVAQRLQIVILCASLLIIAWALHADLQTMGEKPLNEETLNEETLNETPLSKTSLSEKRP